MYTKIPFWRFLIGLGIVAIPAALFERSGNHDEAMRYVGIILLMMLVANSSGVQAFEQFITKEL